MGRRSSGGFLGGLAEMPYFYHADIRVDGLLWYHTRALPSTQFYISQPYPVIHNYGLTLALAGFIVDPDMGYASLFNLTRYKRPLELYYRYGVYAYPPLVVKALLGEVLMAAMNEGIATLRGRSRLAYPLFTKNTILMPGSQLRTLIIVSEDRAEDVGLPRKLVVRIGAKRGGVLRLRLQRVEPEFVENAVVSHPFNLLDSVRVDEYTVILPHPAGDIGVFGRASEALEYEIRVGRTRRVKVTVPVLEGM